MIAAGSELNALQSCMSQNAYSAMHRFASRTDWSQTLNPLTTALEERRDRGLPILDLTESNPTRCGFTYDSDEILKALADPRSLTYSPDPRGLLAARVAIRDYYAERSVEIEPEQIFLTTSTSEAYSHVFRLLADQGDRILVPQPSYPLFDFLARLDVVHLARYPLDYDGSWRIDCERLTQNIDSRARAVLVVNPNNPTGSFLHQDELESLLECCTSHGLALVGDEVFVDYVIDEDGEGSARRGTTTSSGAERVDSLAATRKALTFTLSGLSKISALPQMKLAWVVVNGPTEALQEALVRLEVIADTYLSVSAPLAWALPRLLETRRAVQPQILNRVKGNLRCLDRHLPTDSPVMRLNTEGGWYAVLRLPALKSDEEWAVELVRREGVLSHPGHFYDFESEGHLVVSLLTPPDIFEEGLQKMLRLVMESV
jgi:alanine-synthesizing transaminase